MRTTVTIDDGLLNRARELSGINEKTALVRAGLEALIARPVFYELVELAAKMPPELKLKEGGKFPLKAVSRGVIPDAVIDRPKGYFPVPALKHVRGPFLELMRGILLSDACIQRGLYQRAYVDELLANPEAHFTRIQGSKLWHLALLEWWLQVHVDGVLGGANAAART